MNKLTSRDQRAAEKWVMKMLDAPDRHRAGLARWMARKDGRWELHDRLLSDMTAAGNAAATGRMRVAKPMGPAPARHPAVMAIAAVGAVVVGVALLGWFLDKPQSISPGDPSMLASRVGEVREVQLDDGSRITLDTDTSLRVRLSAADRVIDLERGRARFMVAHDATRPFIVQVAGAEVVATGTAFDVSSRNRVVVHLLQGGVEVRLAGWKDSGNPALRLRLRPGEQLSFMRGQVAPLSAMSARPSDEQWISGVKSLDDVPISDLIAEANSYSDTKIVLADQDLGTHEIFGDVHIRDIEAVAQAIATYLEAEIDRSEPGKLIIRK